MVGPQYVKNEDFRQHIGRKLDGDSIWNLEESHSPGDELRNFYDRWTHCVES